MSLRWQVTLLGASILVTLPFIIVHAQTADSEPSPEAPVGITESPVVPESVVTETELPTEGDGIGATAEVTETVSSENPPAPEEASGEETAAEPSLLEAESASSTASSTEPVSEPQPVREVRTVFLQPSVETGSHLQVGPVTAQISLQNLTCRYCEVSSPSVTIKAFYAPWYDNDGTDRATTTERLGEQTYSVSSIAPWQSELVQWSGEITTAGRYSFIVLVDPDNLIGARDVYRTEFFVD